MADQHNRVHARFPCNLPVTVWTSDGKAKLGEGKFTDIGMGGAFLEGVLELEKDTIYHFQTISGGVALALAGHVVRVNSPRRGDAHVARYGVNFNLNPKQEGKLKLGLDKVRMDQPEPPIADKLKWYWGI